MEIVRFVREDSPSSAPSLTDWRVDDDSLRLLVWADDTDSGFDELIGKIARELLEYRERDAKLAPPDAAAVVEALDSLSRAMLYHDDERGPGVNAALRLIEALQRGTADRAIEELLAAGDDG